MKPALNFLLLFCFYLPNILYAQENRGKLLGTVTDSTHKPISYATISLLKAGQSGEVVKRTYSSNKGYFELTADTGKYILSISHVGFPGASLSITIKAGENFIDSVKLTSTLNLLQNATVTVRKPLIEQGDDRITYNAESDPAAKSESATDLLRKTPMITVDGDGNVQLNGQNNFKILLNGRETSMFAMNVKEALRNFTGAVISKIEVITSPSAKYDAEGVGGIVNIVTKKKVLGYKGSLSSYYSTLNHYSDNASINLKAGKAGISGYAGIGGIATAMSSKNTNETTPSNSTAFSKRTLSGDRSSRYSNASSNLEITYDLDSFKTIALYGSLERFSNDGYLNQAIITEHNSQSSERGLFLQDNSSSNPNSGFGTDFICKFRNSPDKELTFRFNGQFSKNHIFTTSFQNNSLQDRYVSNESLSRNREYTFQADFAQPLKAKQKLETGVKAIFRNASSDFKSRIKYSSAESYKLTPSNSDLFNYHQEVYSLYASYNFSLRKFSFRTGLRAEHTNVNEDFITSKTTVNQRYTNLIPNFLLTRKFSSGHTLTASYNMRLQRPYITSLNPFINNNDSLNISYGNPNLGSQVLHAVSVQNQFTKGKLFASISVNATYTNNMIVQFARFDPFTGVTSITSANVGKEYQSSLGFNLSTPIVEKLTIGVTTQLRYNRIENKSNLLQEQEGFSGLAGGNFYYKVVGKFTISGSGGANRNTYTLVNSPSTQYFYQVNFGYKFFSEKLAVTMNVNNFHNRYMRYRMTTEDPNFRIVSTNINPFQVIFFGATYNFGKLKENISKKKGITNDDLVQ